METYNFLDMPTLNKKLVIDLARCEWIGRRRRGPPVWTAGTVVLGLGGMDNWFAWISAETQLSSEAAYALHTDGFIVLPGPVPEAGLAKLAYLFDEAVSGAAPDDI